MATVFLPAMLRELAGGTTQVAADGATVGEIIADLDRQFPGLQSRLIEGGELRSNLAVAIDGEVSPYGVRETVGEQSEVHFVLALSGG
jgi:molybdopterin synthase sulfur carrier subunit